MHVVIHCNQSLKHQVELSRQLQSGFKAHEQPATITHSRNLEADLHIVMGPWFAFNEWRYHNTLYIDRGYWDDPDCVSVHWLRDGHKQFSVGHPPRKHPAGKPYKKGIRRIYLCDYQTKPTGDYENVRWHPSDCPNSRTLAEDLAAHDTAIGRVTTALVDAALAGLEVRTDVPYSPVWPISGMRSEAARDRLLNNLAWHNWSRSEIASGEMWNALNNSNSTNRLSSINI